MEVKRKERVGQEGKWTEEEIKVGKEREMYEKTLDRGKLKKKIRMKKREEKNEMFRWRSDKGDEGRIGKVMYDKTGNRK